jgi:hypothetical protein
LAVAVVAGLDQVTVTQVAVVVLAVIDKVQDSLLLLA